jgi:hypothetical protein
MKVNSENESECRHADPFVRHSERSEESLQFVFDLFSPDEGGFPLSRE